MSNETEEYRLVVVRRAPLPTPEDLTATLDWLVKALQSADPPLLTLSGLTPALNTVQVLEGEESRVHKFLATSEIQWNFGRDAADPTHEVSFFNAHEDARLAVLRVSFVAHEAACTGPGLVAELRLGLDAAGPPDALRGAHLDQIFSFMTGAVHPDFGHVELPGHPGFIERPGEYQVGWITYLAHGEAVVPPIPPPAVVLREEGGTKILATREIALQRYGDVVREIDAVREALAPEEILEPDPEPEEPAPVPVMQAASYMGARPGGQFALDDEGTQTGAPAPAAPAALPFATPSAPREPASPRQTLVQMSPPFQQPPAATPFQQPPAATPFQQPPAATPFQQPPVSTPFPQPPPSGSPLQTLVQPSTPFQQNPPAATPFPQPPPSDPGPRRPMTVPIPPASHEPTKEQLDLRRRRVLPGLPFAPKPGDDKDPKKG